MMSENHPNNYIYINKHRVVMICLVCYSWWDLFWINKHSNCTDSIHNNERSIFFLTSLRLLSRIIDPGLRSYGTFRHSHCSSIWCYRIGDWVVDKIIQSHFNKSCDPTKNKIDHWTQDNCRFGVFLKMIWPYFLKVIWWMDNVFCDNESSSTIDFTWIRRKTSG